MKIQNQEEFKTAFEKLDILIVEGFEGDSEKSSNSRKSPYQ